MAIIDYEIQQDIGVLRINNPPVNALSQALREALVNTISAAQTDASKALVIICEGRTFIAGADISEFNKPAQPPSLPEALTAVEASKKPVIAAIHGSALGGGLETALACHYRCAIGSASMGLPEVKLGLLPGAGGTQRLPRLIGVEPALDMITSGNPINAGKAQQLGLIDELIEGDAAVLQQGAVAFAQRLVAENQASRKASELNIDPSSVAGDLFEKTRAKLAKRARGQIAPQHIVSCVEAAVQLDFEAGMQKERELFLECRQSPQSAAMRHLFFAERQAAKISDVPKDTPLRPVKQVAIIGGGTMGGGIAMNFANAGIQVTLLEINDEALARGLGIIEKNYGVTVSKGKLSEEQMNQCLARVKGTTDYDDLSDADLVIEAVFENLEIKQQVFKQLDATCKPSAILATNTSYQDVNAIAQATSRPQDVIGLHFFSPANVMKLLEVVRGDATADDVLATAFALAKTIKKVPVLSRVCYGFIGNRMLRYYFRETQLCLIEGATPEQIDTAMQEWGMAMGPVAVGDLAGLDIGYKARQALSEEERGDPKTYCIADALVEAGRLGQKTGEGYYRYDPQTRARQSDPAVLEIIEQQAKAQGVERRDIDSQEIVDRLIFALINEGARILEEGIAQRPGDIDIVYTAGYGFPVFRGGPMHYADHVGLKTVYGRIEEFRAQFGDANWTPAPLLEKLANNGQSFAEWDAQRS